MKRLFGVTAVNVFTPGIFLISASCDSGTASTQSIAPDLNAATRVRSSGMIFSTRCLTFGRASLFQ
jgi:hypothetical protein